MVRNTHLRIGGFGFRWRRNIRSATVACCVAVGASAVVVVPADSAGAATPPGVTNAIVGKVARPVALTRVAGSGDLLVAGQGGTLSVMTQSGQVRTVLTVPNVCAGGEQGLLGVTNDIGAATGSYVYLYATRNKPGSDGDCLNQVSRFTWNAAGIDPATELVLIDNLDGFGTNHNGGDIQFGKDGNLYIGVGDGGCDSAGRCGSGNTAARDNGHLLGKVLRITRTGDIPSGNPFSGAGTVRCNTGGRVGGPRCQEIFATGLRNPFRMGFDLSAPGVRVFINDVGQDVWEEVDEGIVGADYGWNTREGNCATGSTTNCGSIPGLTNPRFAYSHADGCSSITGGAFAPPGWPTATGTYFFADYTCNKIFQLTPNGAGGFRSSVFLDGLGAPIDVKSFDDGAMYYTDINEDTVHRITYDSATVNAAPGRFVPLVPTRIADTRNNLGFSGSIESGATVTLDIPKALVPDEAVAASVNITVTGPGSAGYVSVWPSGTRRPDTSAVNYMTDETVANSAVVPTGPSGRMNVFASARTHVVVDVTGYWRPRRAFSTREMRSAFRRIVEYRPPARRVCWYEVRVEYRPRLTP
jgi:glucose/arabinose dehydrogenase